MPAKAKILVVDDETLFASSLADIFKSRGYAAIIADNGKDALSILKKRPFDIVFLDVRMPDMDGLQTLKKIKKLRSQCIVIMLTAFSFDVHIKDCLKEGAYTYFYKPIDPKKVLETIENILPENKRSRSKKLSPEKKGNQMTKKKILIIDDNKNFLTSTEDILQKAGFEPIPLSDPTKTEDYIKKTRPDLIIMDIFMPKRSGFNILEDLAEKNLYRDIPKIMLTVLDDSNERLAARASGACEYISKPFNPGLLIDTIHQCLKNAKYRKS